MFAVFKLVNYNFRLFTNYNLIGHVAFEINA